MKILSEETSIEKTEPVKEVKKSFSMSPALITTVLLILIAVTFAVISYFKNKDNGNERS